MQETVNTLSVEPPSKTVVLPPESKGLGRIASENFVAGASRALGTVVVYLIFLVLMFTLFSYFVWPRLEPYVNTYTNAIESLQTLQQFSQPGSATPGMQNDSAITPLQLQELLNSYQF